MRLMSPPAGMSVLDAEDAWQKGFAKVPNRIEKGHVECPDLTSGTFNRRGFRATLSAGFRFGIRESGFTESGVGAVKPVLVAGFFLLPRR